MCSDSPRGSPPSPNLSRGDSPPRILDRTLTHWFTAEDTMNPLTLLAGGFVNFIATYIFDPDARSLALVKQNPTGSNTSWIERYVVDPSFLLWVSFLPVDDIQSH